jgi:hypothetical protein
MQLNGIIPVTMLALDFEVSVIAYEGDLDYKLARNRETLLSVPAAKEIFINRIALDGSKWVGLSYALTSNDGSKREEKIDAMFGFYDPLPDHLSILTKQYDYIRARWHYFIQLGKWNQVDTQRFKNLSRVVFFRVIKSNKRMHSNADQR